MSFASTAGHSRHSTVVVGRLQANTEARYTLQLLLLLTVTTKRNDADRMTML